jgi:hypothetical protein
LPFAASADAQAAPKVNFDIAAPAGSASTTSTSSTTSTTKP